MGISDQELANIRERHSAALYFGFTLRTAKAQARKDGLDGFLERLDQMIDETEALKINAEQEMRRARASDGPAPPIDERVPLLRASAEWCS